MITRKLQSDRGAVLIVAMLITAMLALVIGSYLNLTLTSSKQTRRDFDRNAAFHLTEAGVEEAVWSYNHALAGSASAWSDWTVDGSAAWRKFTDFTLTPGSTGSVKVYASDINPAGNSRPVIVAAASVQTGSAPPVRQMLEVSLRRRSFFANGLTALRTLQFRGNRASYDSWNSDPDNNPATPPIPYALAHRRDVTGIASGAVDASDIVINQATIYGYVATAGAIPEVGENGLIGPFDTPLGVVDPSRVTTDFNATFPVVTSPLDGEWITSLGPTLGTAGETTRWRTPSIHLSGNQTLTILGDVTVILTAPPDTDALKITGSASLIIPAGSSLTLYVEGNISIGGKGLANDNPQPITCILWGSNSTKRGQSIDVAGRGALASVIYAPNGDVSVNGNGDIFGSIVARDITFTGNAAFHYDESLANLVDHAPFGPDRWRLLRSANERKSWSPRFEGW